MDKFGGGVLDFELPYSLLVCTAYSWLFSRALNFLYQGSNRGGASGATLTGDVDGSSRYMYVCMYTYVKPLGQLLHAHAWVVLSQQFSKFIFAGKGNSGKKISWSGVDSNRGLMHCRPLPLPPSQWGSGKFGSYTVDCCSEC